VIRWAVRNRGGLGWRIGFGQQGKSSFRSRLPSKSTENFSDHHLTESQPSSNPAIAQASRLEAQNRTVASSRLGPHRTACGSSLRADEGVQSSGVQALLEAAQGSRGVTERARQIVLIDVSGFVQRNQGIGFGRAILSFAKSLCPVLKGYLPDWRTLFGLGLQADSSIGESCSQKT
jgi:hypothetical protein